jgi:hypothetical protein
MAVGADQFALLDLSQDYISPAVVGIPWAEELLAPYMVEVHTL